VLVAATTRTSTRWVRLPPEPFEFLLLKHAEKFRLKFEGKVADFVEEQRPAVGEFEAADFLADGAGERARAHGRRVRIREDRWEWASAINFNEGAIAPRD